IVGFGLVGTFVIAAIFAPLIAPYDPRKPDLLELVQSGGCCPGPSWHHLFGLDQLGRDEFSRIIYGARTSLVVGLVAVAVRLSLGLVIGGGAGYVGGFVGLFLLGCFGHMLPGPGGLLGLRNRVGTALR